MAHVDLSASYKKLRTAEQKEALRDWLGWVDTKPDPDDESNHPIGLWVHGSRRSGSSYIAEVAVRKMADRGAEWERLLAYEIIQVTRKVWSMEAMVRSHPDDYGLWMDYTEFQTQLDFVWGRCEVLWIDDLHHEALDMNFWRRHVQYHVEQRLKQGLITVVSTTMEPTHPELTGLERAVTDLFVVCDAEG